MKLELKDIDFVYPKSDRIVLRGLNVSFEEGTVSSIRGDSGAGKSTLLYLISGFSKKSGGQMLWNGEEVTDLDTYRRTTVGTISQSYLLFPTRTVLENVSYPLILDGYPKEEAEKRAKELLESVGIEDIHYKKLPEKLSGGEQQRVAIARCLAANSKIIVADEPTGNLDQTNTQGIINIFKDLAHNQNKIVVIVTHDPAVAEEADIQYFLKEGVLVSSLEQ
ncbi:MAG: ABC transporter ATP-binding protein [Tissierellia bacterium]|nr:ABC transporter ATP-binding protein [Tissierellia bacterium]